MSLTAVKIKIMPISPETSIKEIKEFVDSALKEEGAKNPQFEIQPIAFGLNALIVLFGWPEEKELESLEIELSEIEGVGSVQIIDIRRAIG